MENIFGSRQSMCGYILTYSRLWRGNICQLWVKRTDLNFCVCSTPLQDELRHGESRGGSSAHWNLYNSTTPMSQGFDTCFCHTNKKLMTVKPNHQKGTAYMRLGQSHWKVLPPGTQDLTPTSAKPPSNWQLHLATQNHHQALGRGLGQSHWGCRRVETMPWLHGCLRKVNPEMVKAGKRASLSFFNWLPACPSKPLLGPEGLVD